jgi:hypothetical protein
MMMWLRLQHGPVDHGLSPFLAQHHLIAQRPSTIVRPPPDTAFRRRFDLSGIGLSS